MLRYLLIMGNCAVGEYDTFQDAKSKALSLNEWLSFGGEYEHKTGCRVRSAVENQPATPSTAWASGMWVASGYRAHIVTVEAQRGQAEKKFTEMVAAFEAAEAAGRQAQINNTLSKSPLIIEALLYPDYDGLMFTTNDEDNSLCGSFVDYFKPVKGVDIVYRVTIEALGIDKESGE